ncbi:MAG: VapC toxin family PIN domain ribonuclease [Anaerolinea sp.]|nr:VapC toxin family PIN domain ribonuclease [Anaerolinea sp.]
MTLVADASAVLALLIDRGEAGQWAARHLSEDEVAAPSLLHFEVANAIRRHVAAKLLEPRPARLAHEALLALQIEATPYPVVARRAWELRENFTLFDASYIALAEMLGATLVTLDARLSRGPGVRCPVLVFNPDD